MQTSCGVALGPALVRSRDLEFSKLKHGQSRTVMINTRDGKVLASYVVDLPTTNPSFDFVTIIQLLSGYRDGGLKRALFGGPCDSGIQETLWG